MNSIPKDKEQVFKTGSIQNVILSAWVRQDMTATVTCDSLF